MSDRMQNKTRWGIMGTGRIAGKFCETLLHLSQAQIYAIGSRREETAKAFGDTYQAAKCYGNYQAFVNDPMIDIIYVATPIGSHYENVKLCLQAGKHVLCEKAFTQTAVQAEELFALAQRSGLFLMEAMWMKCQPVFQQIIEWNRQGLFGVIQGVESRFYTMAGTNHRLLKDRNQGGALYDLTIYPITYACALLGYEPKQIHALGAKGGDKVDIMESIQLTYPNGSFASVSGGLSCQRQVSLNIQGTKGRLYLQEEHFYKAQKVALLNLNNEIIAKYQQPFAINGYEYEAIEAMECICKGQTQSRLVPMSETIHVIRMMEECRRQWDYLHK